MLHAIIALERGVVLRSVQLTHFKRCLGKSCSRWDICEVFWCVMNRYLLILGPIFMNVSRIRQLEL